MLPISGSTVRRPGGRRTVLRGTPLREWLWDLLRRPAALCERQVVMAVGRVRRRRLSTASLGEVLERLTALSKSAVQIGRFRTDTTLLESDFARAGRFRRRRSLRRARLPSGHPRLPVLLAGMGHKGLSIPRKSAIHQFSPPFRGFDMDD
jgi:hypothetical protein